ncbi:MAG TPA: phosphate ABC transporter permease PstA [Ktedonobacterales bacterium]|nr:phosphate ABC transporter permease PstA [Ktedonobacterales bacterium]
MTPDTQPGSLSLNTMNSMNTRGIFASRRARVRLWDRIMTGLLWTLAGATALLLAALILTILVRGVGVITLPFLTQANVTGDDVGPEIFNTFYIIGLALLICVPIGVGGAVYLVEYARQGRYVTMLRFATETLAGVPSIILGLFGFLVFVTAFGQGSRFGFSRLAAALTLMILNLPLLLRVSEDALRSVPKELREASEALGATRFQTVSRVLLPAALEPLTTGIILTAGKMIGETAAVIFTGGGNSSINGWFSLNPLTAGDTLSVHLYELQAEGVVRNALQIENGTAAVLIILLLVFNLGFRYLAGRLTRRLRGSV